LAWPSLSLCWWLSAAIFRFVDHQLVEAGRADRADLEQVLVAAVARRGHHAHQLARRACERAISASAA
jgi:hypothetical protein